MGATPIASGTTPPALTLTGSVATNPALRVEVQTTGTDGVATYRYGAANDGTTSTWIEQNLVVPAGGGTYAAIGTLAGLTFNFPAGSYTNDNVYQGTASAWQDQKNLTTYAQATAAKQPRILLNSGGRIGLRGDGINDSMLEPTLDLPAPNVTPTFIWFVVRQVTFTLNEVLFDCGPGTEGATVLTTAVSPGIGQYCGSTVNSSNGATVGALIRGYASFTGTTSDAVKLGAAAVVTGASAGVANPSAGVRLFAAFNDTAFSNFDAATVLYFNAAPSGAELSALDTAASSLYSGLVV